MVCNLFSITGGERDIGELCITVLYFCVNFWNTSVQSGRDLPDEWSWWHHPYKCHVEGKFFPSSVCNQHFDEALLKSYQLPTDISSLLLINVPRTGHNAVPARSTVKSSVGQGRSFGSEVRSWPLIMTEAKLLIRHEPCLSSETNVMSCVSICISVCSICEYLLFNQSTRRFS